MYGCNSIMHKVHPLLHCTKRYFEGTEQLIRKEHRHRCFSEAAYP
jgi:hypothetical protein